MTSYIKTRKFTLHRDKQYTIPSTGMIQQWKIITPNAGKALLVIGENIVNIPRKDANVFNFKEIRKYISDIIPETCEQHMIARLEYLFYEQQIMAMPYYGHVDDDLFSTTLFTGDIKKVQLDFGSRGLDTVEIEETYITRDV